MGRIRRVEVSDGVFHVICRGNGRQDIFHDRQDRETFLRFLAEGLARYNLKLHAYVLMDNHLHLLLQTPDANLSPFMQQLNVRYTGWYNWKYNHSGHLYQGPYKRILVEQDSHLTMLSRYIHLNPVRVQGRREWSVRRQIDFLKSYEWGSLPAILDSGIRPRWLATNLILSDYRGDAQAYLNDMESDLRKDRKPPDPDPLGFLGSLNFVKEMVSRVYGTDHPFTRSRIQGPVTRNQRPETVTDATARVLNMPPQRLLTSRGEPRQILIEALSRNTGLTGRDIAHRLGITESAVSVSRKRLQSKVTENPTIDEQLKQIAIYITSRQS